MKIEAVKGKSPYAKKQKKEFKYSEYYQRWSNAVGQAGVGYGTLEATNADRAFRRAWGLAA